MWEAKSCAINSGLDSSIGASDLENSRRTGDAIPGQLINLSAQIEGFSREYTTHAAVVKHGAGKPENETTPEAARLYSLVEAGGVELNWPIENTEIVDFLAPS